MRTQLGRPVFLVAPSLLAAVLGGVLAAQPSPRLGALDRRALARAEGLFAEEEEAGDLPVEAVYVLRGAGEAGEQASLEVLADLEGQGLGSGGSDLRFRVSLVVESRDGETTLRHHEATAVGAAAARFWSFEATLALPAEVRDLVVIVEELPSGLWGAVVAEPAEERMAARDGTAVSVRPGLWSLAAEGGEEAAAGGTGTPEQGGEQTAGGESTVAEPPAGRRPRPSEPGGEGRGRAPQADPARGREPGDPAGAPAEPAEAGRSTVIRLLRPQGRRLAGPTSFDTLVSDPAVAKVTFSLDGAEVAADAEDPFEARIALAGPGQPQTVEAVAFAADGRRLSSDSLSVNDPVRAFRVRLARVEGRPEEGLEVEAEVSVPGRSRLARVEIYWNEERVARLAAPPWTAHIEARRPTGQDFVRAVATLTDGAQAEDVRLLNAQGVVEEIDVTLVELFVVASDRDGRPVRDLTAADFEVRMGGRPQGLERVSFASEVPLLLGVVIDNSASMEPILEDTKQAASQFLASTLTDLDRAFLVDFSDRPRLRHRASGSLMDLLGSFKGMRAEGNTALYDAVLFSLLEFADGPGRRALVLLTDGADTKSHFSVNRAVRDGRRIGVPVYVIALDREGALSGSSLPQSGPLSARGGRGRSRGALSGSALLEMEAVTKETGGRLYLAGDLADLSRAYAEINDELRSQYLLTFYVQGETEGGSPDVEVGVRRRGHSARVVVSPE